MSSVWRRYVAIWLLALFGALAVGSVANAETRTLKLYFVHTREKAEITYKRNGRYIKSGLTQINRFLRDWRRNEPTKMDPQLLDLIWEVYRKSGSRKHIHVISAYRSPATNAMLRKRGRGVAKKSQHMLGRAMDFYLPDVKLSKLRRIGLKMQVGGVGYYPRSGSPFVHMDVGSVRHWPRMSRRELVAMFPNGKTLHLPKDGKPLPGYNQALASYKKRQKSGSSRIVLASAEPSKPEKKRTGGGFLAAFFSGGADGEEDSVQAATAPKRVKTIPAPAETAKQPKTPEMIIAALPARDVPLPLFAPRPKVDVGETVAVPASETGEAVETEALETLVAALDVPRPTPRPGEFNEAVIAERIAAALPPERSGTAVVAMAGKSGSEDTRSALNVAQSGTSEKGDRVVAVPLPENRPDAVVREQIVVAALPTAAPRADVTPDRFGVPVFRDKQEMTDTEAIVGTVISQTPDDKPIAATSPRELLLASVGDPDPVETITGGIRTTDKTRKPVATDQPAEPKVMIVPLPESLSRRAFSKTHIARAQGYARAPSFVFDLVGRAPKEIYTVGFSRSTVIANPYRFTGKAVQFLSVARFN